MTTTEAAPPLPRVPALASFLVLASASLVVYELLLTRLFSLVVFAHLANFAIGVALLGIGFGATCLHLFPRLVPADRLGSRLGAIAILQGLSLVAAVAILLATPLNEQWSDRFFGISSWNAQARSLVNSRNLALVVPVLMVPFFFGGLGFSAVFKLARDKIGGLYAADLWGGAFGGLLFIPALSVISGPDTAFVAAGLAGAAAFGPLMSTGQRGLIGAAVLLLAASVALALTSASGKEVLKIRYTAGFPESEIVYREWTPVARVAIHKHKTRRRDEIVLDTTSSSVVVDTEARRADMLRAVDRTIPFQLVNPDRPVAIIAAAAGSEVAVAQALGFHDITAIDIVGRYFPLVRDKYAKVAVNPYRQRGVQFLEMDGRAGIVHAGRKYGVILMRWANLHNAAGLISNAWSPNLLETKEAFADYLDHIRPDGILSFSKGGFSTEMIPSVVAALRERGVKSPYACIAWISGRDGKTLLVRPRPWTRDESAELNRVVASLGGKILISPAKRTPRMRRPGGLITDDRPYRDRPSDLWAGLKMLFGSGSGGLGGRVNMMLWAQAISLAVAGLLFVGVPFAFRSRSEIAHLSGKGYPLAYAAAIGFGYLAIETVLIHELVLFVGHPTYAITLVILVMLLGSGLGSMRVGRHTTDLPRRLVMVLFIVVALSLVQALVMPPVYHAALVRAPIWLRMAVVGVTLLPLAYFMGMPFPLALRVMPAAGGELVPWMWALNGWMSVAATMSTVFFSRQLGFKAALMAGVLAYVVALVTARKLPFVRAAAPVTPVAVV